MQVDVYRFENTAPPFLQLKKKEKKSYRSLPWIGYRSLPSWFVRARVCVCDE